MFRGEDQTGPSEPEARDMDIEASEAGEIIGNQCFGFRKEELVMLMMRTLADMGYSEAVNTLKIESGLRIETATYEAFHQELLAGHWDTSFDLLKKMSISARLRNQVRLWMLETMYVESLCAGSLNVAMQMLNSGMEDISTARKHLLAMCLAAPEIHLNTTVRALGIAESRAALLIRVSLLMPPEVVVPRGRLENLILQGIAFQSLRCPDYQFQESCTAISSRENLSANTSSTSVYSPSNPSSLQGSRLDDPRCIRSRLSTESRFHSSSVDTRPQYIIDASAANQRCSSSAVGYGYGYLHSLFVDIENINLLRVLPRKEVACLRGHRDEVLHLSISPNSRFLVSASRDGVLVFWDMEAVYENLAATVSLTDAAKIVYGVPVPLSAVQSTDGIPLSASINDFPVGGDIPFRSLHWDSNGQYLLACTSDLRQNRSTVYCWKVVNMKSDDSISRPHLELFSAVKRHERDVLSKIVQISADINTELDCASFICMKSLSLFVSTGEQDHTIFLCDLKNGSCLAELSEKTQIIDMAVLPIADEINLGEDVVYIAGFIMYATGEKTLTLCSIDLCRTSTADISRVAGNIHASDRSTDCYSFNYRLAPLHVIELPYPIMTISADSNIAKSRNRYCTISFSGAHGCALVSMERNSIQVIQLYALDPLSQDCQERFVLRAALGSEYLSTAESSEHLVVIDNADFPPGCYDQGSSLVASGREDGSVVLWRRDQKNPIASLKGHTGVVNDICWVPHVPKLLVTASDDRTIRLWY